MIKLENVNRRYRTSEKNEVHALQNVDLTIYTNELTAIVGASGSGKSTLMNILGGLDGEFTGEVEYKGKKLNGLAENDIADYRKDNIGFIFQHFHLIPHLTVLENVMLALSMTNVSKEEKIKRSKKMIHKVGLEHVIEQKGNELSGGQKQRVAIARALVKNPSIILADEPTGALDSTTSQEIIELLHEVVTNDIMVIIITHAEDIANNADRCITLKDGKIVEDKRNKERQQKEKEDITEKVRTTSIRKSSYKEAIHLSKERIRYNKWRYFLVSLGGIVGLMGLMLAFLLTQGVNEYIKESYEKMIDGRKVVISKEGKYIDNDTFFSLQKNDKIDYIQKEHNISGVMTKDGNQMKFKVKPLQKEVNRENHAKPVLLHGSYPKDGEKGILLDEGLAKNIVKEGESIASLVGKTFEAKYLSPDIVSNYPARWDHQELKIVGIVEKSFVGEDYSFVGYQTHEDMVRRSRFISKNGMIESNELAVYMKNSEDIQSIVKTIGKEYQVITPQDQVKSLVTTFNLMKVGIFSVAVVILVIASIMVGIILFISVLERRNEIGVLKALGGRRNEIRWIFFAEGGLVGIFASGTAIIIIGILYAIGQVVGGSGEIIRLFKPSVWAVVATIIVGIGTHLIATIIPANKASKFDPVELLRD